MNDPYGGVTAGTDRGRERMSAWTNPLETIELTDQEALREFCETGRKFARYLSILTSVAATELEEGMKEMARGSGKAMYLGIDVRMKIRRTVRHLSGAGDAFEAAAGQFLASWVAFERDFADVLAERGHTPVERGFRIT